VRSEQVGYYTGGDLQPERFGVLSRGSRRSERKLCDVFQKIRDGDVHVLENRYSAAVTILRRFSENNPVYKRIWLPLGARSVKSA